MDRFLGAGFVVLVCNLIVLVKANYDIDYHKLYKFEEALHRVANEKKFLRERSASILELKTDLDESLVELNNARTDITNRAIAESGSIQGVADRIKLVLHRLGDLEAKVAGQVAVSARNKKILDPTWRQIDQLASGSNVRQSATLINAENTMQQNSDKVRNTLSTSTLQRLDDIMAVRNLRVQFTRQINTRKCYSVSLSLEFDPVTAEAASNVSIPLDFFPNGAFLGESVPTVLCGVEGVLNSVELDDQKGNGGYGYGYEDELQSTAVTVDCQPFFDRVEVKAFDQSRGKGNGVSEVYVGVRACSFAAMAGFAVNS